MPAGPRIRANGVFGLTTDNPLTAGATTFNSGGLSELPVVSSAHAIVILDPREVFGESEIVVVTTHTAAATVATITRGQYGTVARSHPQNTEWVHSPIDEDFIEILTSGAPSNPYEGQLWYRSDTDIYMAHNGSAAVEALPLGAWQSYTPTLTQSATITKTVTRARYTRYGRFIQGQFSLTASSSGTTANAVAVGLPVAAAVSSGVVVGNAFIYDASTVLRYSGALELATASVAVLVGDWSADQAWGVVPNLAMASGDLFRGVFQYEADA